VASDVTAHVADRDHDHHVADTSTTTTRRRPGDDDASNRWFGDPDLRLRNGNSP